MTVLFCLYISKHTHRQGFKFLSQGHQSQEFIPTFESRGLIHSSEEE